MNENENDNNQTADKQIQTIQTDKIVENQEEEDIKRQIDKLNADLRLKNLKKVKEELERELQEPEISEDVKTSKTLTVYEATKIAVRNKKYDNNQLLQIPMEELLNLLGISDEDVISLEDALLYNMCDDLSGGKNNRLIVRVKIYKNKLIKEKEQETQRLIREEQIEQERLIQEEKIENQRQLDEKKKQEDQANKAKEEQIRRTFNPCPYCQQRTVNKKVLIKNKQAQCENPSCGKIVEYCSTCRGMSKIEDEHVCPEDMIKYLDAKERYEQQEQRQREDNALKQQEEMLKRQEEISKQQIKEQLVKQPIKYGTPNLTETILDTKFFQSALSNVPDTIEALRKAIGEQGTERLVNALVSKVKKE